MKFALALLIPLISYNLASASWLSDITKGIREGVEDAYEDGKKVVQSAGEKVEKTVDAHPLLKEHKINLHKLIKKAGKDVEKWHKKFAKKFGLKDNKEADKKFHKHWKMINKWMSTLTKNDTDGNEVHQIPFVPHVNVHNDKSSEEEERQKSLDVFKKLAFMWKEEVESKIEKKGKDLLGWDEEKIHPKVEKKEAKEDEKKEEPLFGRDELEIEPKYVKEKKPSVPFLLFKFEDEDALMKKQAEKVAAEQEAMSTIRKTSEELIDEEVLKGLKKEAEELKKKSKEQKEVSAEEFFKKAQDIGKDWGKNEMETKKKVESPENQMPDKSVNFKKIEATIIKEQKFYAEAEKQWKEEMEKKAKEMSKKTTEQKEITEELKEPKEITEEMREPEEEMKKPEDVTEEMKEPEEEEDVIHKVPLRVSEDPSIFKKPNLKKVLNKMSDSVKTLFKDIESRKRFMKEEKQWQELKDLINNKFVQKFRNKAYWKKKQRDFKKKNPLFAKQEYIEE